MSSRQPLIIGNWKMHKTTGEAKALVREILQLAKQRHYPLEQLGVCPSFTALAAVVDEVGNSGLPVYAQNMHEAKEGAFTGEVSATMLSDLAVGGVVLGHSERRQYFAETDAALARKLPVAFAAGLQPIFCVGETQAQREAGETERVLRHQVLDGLHGLAEDHLGDLVVAYEPVWAIGTGLVASPQQAQEAAAFIRALIASKSPEQAERVRVLYGGSVKPENAQEILALADVDGALVGGASLEAESFLAIAAAAGSS